MIESAFLVTVGAVAGGFGSWLLQFLQARHKMKSEAQASTIVEWQTIVTRQDAEIARLQLQLQELQAAVHNLYNAFNETQVESADLYGYLVRMRDLIQRQAREITDLGGNPEPVPDIPPRQAYRTMTVDFAVRTVEQNKLLVSALSKDRGQPPVVKPPVV